MRAEWSDDAYDGKKSIQLKALSAGTFVSIWQDLECTPDSELTASMYIKSPTRVCGYFRIYFFGPDGKLQKKYLMSGLPAQTAWSRCEYRFRVPSGVKKLRFCVEMVGNKAPGDTICFDKVELAEKAGPVLKNALIRAEINPLVGGAIDQLTLQTPKGPENLTCKRTLNAAGGLAVDIIPARKNPGLFADSSFKLQVLQPGRKIAVSAERGELRLEKTFTLDPVLPRITVECALTNCGKSARDITWRIHNVLPGTEGFFTAPTKDWLQSVNRNAETIKTMNAVDVNNFMGSWLAKTTPKAALVAEFPRGEVEQGYNYMSDSVDTVEWYFRGFRLAPGATRRFTYTLTAIPEPSPVVGAENGRIYTVDDLVKPANGSVYDGKNVRRQTLANGEFPIPGAVFGARNYKAEFIRGIKLPPPPKHTMPEKLKGFFPYAGSDPALTWKESSGTDRNNDFVAAAQRSFREAAKNNLNHIELGRLSYSAAFASGDLGGGKNVIGELGRRYGLHYSVDTLAFGREHVDVEKSAADIRKRIAAKLTPETVALIKKYPDLFLYIATADEPRAQNIPAMLYAHSEIHKLLPGMTLFPVVNLHQFSFIPYVPVFCGDWYPISRDSGRKPWSVEEVTKEMVKHSNGVPCYIMLQAFGYRTSVYGLPTAGEMRLMIGLAAACGAKGIYFHETVNRGLPWRYNYGYDYTVYGNAGETIPAWGAIGECGKWVNAVGPLLTEMAPDAAFQGVQVQSREYHSPNHFYNGPEVKSYVLSGPRGRVVFAVNQNVKDAASATVRFTIPAGEKLYSLATCREVPAVQNVKLKPGESALWYLGKDTSVPLQTEENYYARGVMVLNIDMERASNNQVHFGDYRKVLINHDRNFRKLAKLQKLYQDAMNGTPFGNFSVDWENARQQLSDVSFAFMRHLDLVIPPALRKATPRYKQWNNTADPVMQKLVDAIAADFHAYWKLDALIEAGEWQKNSLPARDLIAKIDKDTKAAQAYLKANSGKITVDDPYADR